MNREKIKTILRKYYSGGISMNKKLIKVLKRYYRDDYVFIEQYSPTEDISIVSNNGVEWSPKNVFSFIEYTVIRSFFKKHAIPYQHLPKTKYLKIYL